MTVDWTKAIMMDSGGPAELISGPDEKGWYRVRCKPDNDDDGAYTWDYNSLGQFAGFERDPHYYRVLNALDPTELDELRAFKTMALERYPDLEPKPETDQEAVERIAQEWREGRGLVERAIRAAIAWARANPVPYVKDEK